VLQIHLISHLQKKKKIKIKVNQTMIQMNKNLQDLLVYLENQKNLENLINTNIIKVDHPTTRNIITITINKNQTKNKSSFNM
jgi:hypothetical protein